MGRYILTLDQGTTSSRAIVFDREGCMVSSAQIEFRQIYPKPGWVEHDPKDIWNSQKKAIDKALEGINTEDIEAVGITNQRETTVIWDRTTGEPVHPAIVWQCRRTAGICSELKSRGLEKYVRDTTGLLIDAYFSGTKIKWILDSDPKIKAKAEAGELCFGTVDSWLLYNLTDRRVHATDFTNASRTMLLNINKLDWDDRMLEILGIPKAILPEIKDTSGFFGYANILGRQVPVMSMAGDQQAALFGQTCFEPGDIKNTYGTGCFILCNTGRVRPVSEHGLLSTIAYRLKGKTYYALEGSVFNAGSAVQWLRDELRIIQTAPESEEMAGRVPDSGGVYFVPAFTGLGAPHWDMYARGTVLGITRGTGREHIVRAVLDSIAYSCADVINIMKEDAGLKIESIFADGGASANEILMQFQADILGIPVIRPVNKESTALGAAFLAGLASGIWKDLDRLKAIHPIDKKYEPGITPERRKELYGKWKKAVERSMGWET